MADWTQRGDRHRVLLVDDYPTIRKAIASHLRHLGSDVVVAANGEEAIAHLRAGCRPCVVILDLMMPLVNGYDVLAHIRAQRELDGTSVIAISADPDQHHAAVAAGAVAFLVKPMKFDELNTAVERYCGRCGIDRRTA